MRTLLITEVFPPQAGGSGRWFWEIYRRLDRTETMVAAGLQEGDAEFDRTHDVNVRRLPMTFPSWGVANWTGLRCYRQLADSIRRLIAEHSATQIHCGKVLPEGFVAWWLKMRLGIPYLCYVHGEELSIAAGSRELSLMAKRAFGSADRVIANSRNTASLLCDQWSLPRDRVTVMYPGVDVDRFCPAQRDSAVRSELGWGDRPVVLTVGRLQKRKGHDRLIEAIPVIRESHPDFLYSIIGDGIERSALERLVAELGVGDHVDFRGEVNDEEMLKCYQQCDLFALPNRTVDGDFEGFGMVLLEAQACGRPVLCGRSGGTGEAMREGSTGIRIDCDVVDAIAGAIHEILRAPERAAIMGNQGRDLVEKHFSWNSLCTKAQECFDEVVPSKAGFNVGA